MHKFFLLAFFQFTLICLFGQVNISGTIADSANKPIIGASVTLHKSNSNLIIAFAISNAKGAYNIEYSKANTNDTFFIKANAIGYKAKMIQVQNFNQPLNFALNTSTVQLPNVVVKNPKPFLKYKADTLSYNVDSFTQKQDRTIGDVLRKMPGIDVDANGKISYNGKAISNFYIDGDNLLDDKYNLATNSIAADMVKDVQVLENHQPIRALKNAAYSDKVGINLNLKDKARLKLTARAEVAAGIADKALYDGTVNLMAFKKNYKAINSFKANNTGVNIAKDVISHNFTDFLKQIENAVPQDMLGLNTPGNPNISQQRYLFNNAALANTNNLFKTQKGVQVKLNLYYLHDKQTQDYTNNAFFFLPNNDTIKYLQQQQTQNRFNVLYAKLNLNSNKDKAYWNNDLVVEYNKLPSISTTTFNGKITNQNLLQQTTSLSNELNIIKTKNTKNVIELYSYFSYLNKPELLQINPGINANYFNNNLAYNQLAQQVNLPTYFTNNYINYRVPIGKFLQSYKIGVNSQWQQLNSNTQLQQLNGIVTNAKDSFTNNLTWQQQKIYANTNYDFLGNRIKISLALPLSWQAINYTDTVFKTKASVNFNQVFFNPTLSLRYATGVESFLSARYSFGNGVATVQEAFGGFIINNINSITNNNIAVKQNNFHSASIGYNYRKTIKIFFANIGLNYTSVNNNSIAQASLLSNLQLQTIIPLNNTVNSLTLNGGISKYLFKLKTTVNVKASVRKADWVQLQNNNLLGFVNNTYTISGGINPKISKWANIGYNGAYTLSNSKAKIDKAIPQSVTQMQHAVELNIFPNDNVFINIKGEDFFVQQKQLNTTNNYFFADASVRYKMNKIKTDFVVEVLNIANVTNYTTINVSANNLTQNSFAIRPRMFLVKAFFNF